MNKFPIRKANSEDAYGITFVHVNTFCSTYKGLIPDNILQTRIDSINERTRKTRKSIENGKPFLVVENTENHEIIGMLTYGASRNEDYPNSGEIISIYLLPEYQKLGIGKKLFFAGIQELLNLGYESMIVNVLKGNNAIGFYQKFGGVIIGEREDSFGSIIMKEYIILFNDIKNIIQ